MGHVARPLHYPPAVYLPDPRSGRFDDSLKEYRTLYCARHQIVALRETLQEFRHSTETLSKLKSVYGAVGVPPAKVPDDWRAASRRARISVSATRSFDYAIEFGGSRLLGVPITRDGDAWKDSLYGIRI